MKLLVFLLLISSTIFSQFKVVNERFVEYKYKSNKTIIITNEIDVESESAFEHFQKGDFIQMSTNLILNKRLSDTLTKLYLGGKVLKENVLMKSLNNMVDNIIIDSTTNLLYREIESECDECKLSILSVLTSDNEIINTCKSYGVKDICVSYVQMRGKRTYELIFVEIHRRFRKTKQFLFIEEM